MAALDANAVELVDGGRLDPELLAQMFLAGYGDSTAGVYSLGLRQWFEFCSYNGLDPLLVRRTHFDLWRRHLEAAGKAPATIANRLGAIVMFYRWLFDEDLIARNPAERIKRPSRPGESPTIGLDRGEVSRLLYAAERGTVYEYALVSLLALNGLRVSEALGIDIESLGAQRGHRTVSIIGKGNKPATIPMPPRVCRAVDLACGERTTGPLILDTRGQRMNRHSAGWVIDKLSRRAGIEHHVHPHALRHASITAALDAGVPLRDVQNMARHADPRTTSRYDRARHNLDRHASYIVASYLAGG